MDLPSTSSQSSSPSSQPVRPALQTIAVVGLGTMGSGIAEVLARAGREVIGIDISEAAARRATTALAATTARSVAREQLTDQEREAVLARFRTFSELGAAADADLVIEVVPESYELKQRIFRELDAIVRPTAILATGTNALSVTRMAAESQRPERVVGLHFFNPAPTMKLVEVVSSVLTAPPAVEAVTTLARELGKEPVAVGDRPGFVADGLLFGYLNQAAAMYEAKYASREDIDAAMKLGCGLPMGPLALLDLIGVDTARTVLEAMYTSSGDRLHAPAPILGHLAEAGLTGQKSGRGFYTYEAPGSQVVVRDLQTPPDGDLVRASRPVNSVGVAGSGTMASGIAQVFAQAGFPWCWRRAARRRRTRRRPRSPSRWPARWTGAADGRGRRRHREPDHGGGLAGRLLRRGPGRGGRRRGPGGEAGAVPVAGQGLQARCGARHHDLLAPGDRDRPRDLAARGRDRHALLQPGSGDEAGRGGPDRPDRRRRARHGPRDLRSGAQARGGLRGPGGFIVNALLFPYLNNAIKMVEQHYAGIDDIDAAMKLGGGYPMGPFELLDVVGLDVSLAIEQVLHKEFRDPGLAPSPLLEHLVAAGCLGRKTGRGFREYAPRR